MLSCTYNIKKVQKWPIITGRGNKLIPYGRGASAIAFQIRAETGQDVPVQEIQDGIDAWKRLYCRAWAYMEQCQRAVLNPGYVETPWGRRRYFPKVKDELLLKSHQREAMNNNIQSGVSDTMRLAMAAVRYERDQRNLRFRICNQIHDALLIAAPVEEVDIAKDILRRRMGSVPIPLADGTYLTLGVDIEVYSRWGEKHKPKH
jgi:DNA polymerase-1